jgi:hypothetical protein
VEQCPSSEREALSSNPTTTKTERKRKSLQGEDMNMMSLQPRGSTTELTPLDHMLPLVSHWLPNISITNPTASVPKGFFLVLYTISSQMTHVMLQSF